VAGGGEGGLQTEAVALPAYFRQTILAAAIVHLLGLPGCRLRAHRHQHSGRTMGSAHQVSIPLLGATFCNQHSSIKNPRSFNSDFHLRVIWRRSRKMMPSQDRIQTSTVAGLIVCAMPSMELLQRSHAHSLRAEQTAKLLGFISLMGVSFGGIYTLPRPGSQSLARERAPFGKQAAMPRSYSGPGNGARFHSTGSTRVGFLKGCDCRTS